MVDPIYMSDECLTVTIIFSNDRSKEYNLANWQDTVFP